MKALRKLLIQIDQNILSNANSRVEIDDSTIYTYAAIAASAKPKSQLPGKQAMYLSMRRQQGAGVRYEEPALVSAAVSYIVFTC